MPWFQMAKWETISGSELSVFESPLDGEGLHVQSDSMTGYTRLIQDSAKLILGDLTCKPTEFPFNRIGFDRQSNPKVAYVVCSDSNKLLSFRMTTKEANLDVRNISLPWIASLIAVDPLDGSRMVAMNADRDLYISLDKGLHWSQLSWPRTMTIQAISFNPFNSDELMLTNHLGTYAGAASHQVSFYQISQQAVSFYADPGGVGADAGYYSHAIYDPFLNGVIYAGQRNGFYCSQDGGKSWQLLNKGLYGLDVRKIIVTNERIYIGVWGSGIATISKSELFNSNALIPCTYSYSEWGACDVDGQETRTVLSMTPENCNASLPVLSRTCVFSCPDGKVWNYDTCQSSSFSLISNRLRTLTDWSSSDEREEEEEFESEEKKREIQKAVEDYYSIAPSRSSF